MNSQKVVVIITDRKDYYHQLWASPARSSTNAVGPSVHSDLLKGTYAFSAYMLQSSLQKKFGWERTGMHFTISPFILVNHRSLKRFLESISGFALAQYFKVIMQVWRLQIQRMSIGLGDMVCLMSSAGWWPLDV